MASANTNVEPFPSVGEDANTASGPERAPASSLRQADRRPASTSLGGRIRAASRSLEESHATVGFMAATSGFASSLASLQTAARPAAESLSENRRAPDQPSKDNREQLETYRQEPLEDAGQGPQAPDDMRQIKAASTFPTGYHFPPKHTFAQTLRLVFAMWWRWVRTPWGFIITIYWLNVVAWGGMIFLLLCNAAPAMCLPKEGGCDDESSPRRKWIEICSQILNALFCVTAFGLAPWRFQDLWHLIQYRQMGNVNGLRRLAASKRGWYRLPGSTELPVDLDPKSIQDAPHARCTDAIPLPITAIPDAPLTGIRARPTKLWKLDAFVWLMFDNTVLQAILSFYMWHWATDYYARPGWAVPTFLVAAFSTAIAAGVIVFFEGKAVKSIEGVPVSEEDLQRLKRDEERGIVHYNNYDDKDMSKTEEKKKRKEMEKIEKTEQKGQSTSDIELATIGK